ncbi:spondin domain-containing protein [Shewanella gaetbuli]
MKRTDLTFKPSLVAIVLATTLLSACGDDNDNMPTVEPTPPAAVMQTFTVTVTNLTANQPLSPVFLAAHNAETYLWKVGQPASVAIEMIAEGGDASGLEALENLTASVTGTNPILPGMSETLTLSVEESAVANISLAAMLGNTNDGFTGVNSYNIAGMEVDAPIMMRRMAYDAGTEVNSEAKGTIPGPADGGEGFNEQRDDINFVHGHPGVISQYDGLADSVLMPSHRFDNPVVAIKIVRTE